MKDHVSLQERLKDLRVEKGLEAGRTGGKDRHFKICFSQL